MRNSATTGAVASGLMSWPWPARLCNRPPGSAAAAARAAARRNGGLCSPLITRAGVVTVASRAACSDEPGELPGEVGGQPWVAVVGAERRLVEHKFRDRQAARGGLERQSGAGGIAEHRC